MWRSIGRRRSMSGGVVDAGLASLASFLCGAYASRFLEPVILGAYALAFRAFVVASILPAQLIFSPSEVAATRHAEPIRLQFISRTLRRGLPAVLSASALVALWPLVWPAGTARSAIVALNVTAILCTFLSPVQDHVRRMLHIGGSSWRAAIVSVAHLATVMLVLIPAVIWARLIPVWWIPLGALAIANLVSLIVGLRLAGRRRGVPPAELDQNPRELLRSGRWLLAVGILPSGTAFLTGAVVSHLGSAAAMGYAEAARIIGQPLLVLSTGLNSVLGPRSIEAVQKGDVAHAHRIARGFSSAMLLTGGAYLLIAGSAWWGNPLAHLLPQAYAIDGLVALTITAHLANSLVFPERSQLLARRKERFLARVELSGNALRFAIAFAARALGAMALPAGLLALGMVRWWALRREVRMMYAAPATAPGSGSVRTLQGARGTPGAADTRTTLP
jgi:O-antigen/teichoic acid export membrane protein